MLLWDLCNIELQQVSVLVECLRVALRWLRTAWKDHCVGHSGEHGLIKVTAVHDDARLLLIKLAESVVLSKCEGGMWSTE